MEKPSVAKAPSNLAIASRYVLTSEIFTALDQTHPGANGEIQLTDALSKIISQGGLYGLCFEGQRYDLGHRLDWLKANILFALSQPGIGTDLQSFLENLLNARKSG